MRVVTAGCFVNLVVPAELSGYVALGLELVARKMREQSISVPDDVLALRSEAIALHSGSSPARASDWPDADAVSDSPLLLAYADVARLLGCSVSTVKRLVASGGLPAVSVTDSARPRVRRADLDAFVEELGGGTFRDRVSAKSPTAPARRPVQVPPAGAVATAKASR